MENQKNIWDNEYKLNKNKWHKETFLLSKVLRNKNVLELGVGNGKTLKSILKQKPKEVVAVDFSTEAINISTKAFSGKNVLFLNTDIRKIPFDNEEFDIVVCYYILNNLLSEDRKKAVSEIYRVLNRKGIVLFEDFADGDFRQDGKNNISIEKDTIIKRNDLLCHFFNIKEIRSLFSRFSKINITKKTSRPLRSNMKIQRKIINATIIK